MNIKKIGLTQKCVYVWKGASALLYIGLLLQSRLTQNSILSKALILARHTKINDINTVKHKKKVNIG